MPGNGPRYDVVLPAPPVSPENPLGRPFLTAKEAGVILACSPETIEHWMRDGLIRRYGKRPSRVLWDDLVELLRRIGECRESGGPGAPDGMQKAREARWECKVL